MLGITESCLSEYQGDDVVITGGLGFIGSNLARALAKQGANVTILDSEIDGYGANRFNISGVEDKVKTVSGDIRNKNVVSDVVEGADWVFHLAAQLSRTVSMENPSMDIKINCIGSVNVLEAIRDQEPDAAVIYTGSQASFGVSKERPFTEESETKPIDIYGADKLAAENYFNIYHRVYGIETRSIRLTNVYGPRAQLKNTNYGVINRFIRLALAGKTLPVYEPGTMRRDPIYIGDVVDALLRVGPFGDAAVPYIIGSGSSVSVLQLAKVIVDIANSGHVELTEWPDDWDSIQVGDITIDNSYAQSDLGWSPSVELEQGFERTIKFYEKHSEEYIGEE